MSVISKLENKGKLSDQLEQANVSAIILRSGRSLAPTAHMSDDCPDLLPSKAQVEVKNDEKNETKDPSSSKVYKNSLYSIPNNIPKASFPSRLTPRKEVDKDRDLLETFKKVQINIFFLSAIKQIPRYVKVS